MLKSIELGLKELHLPMMREMYKPLAEKATTESIPYEHYLYWLIEQEQEHRRVKRIERRLEDSKLPLSKMMTNFEMKRLPHKLARQIQGLLNGDFIRQKENLLVFGNPGSGKTHLLAALGQELIRRYDMRIQFIPSNRLLQELLAAKANFQLPKLLKKLISYNGLIIDDIGYIQQSKEEVEVLFTLIAECYEKTSILLTSNLPFSKWDQIFRDPMMTTAAIDRLIHHSVILEINVPSYRMEESKEKKRQESDSCASKNI
jgi:DNA replication protein DnaC